MANLLTTHSFTKLSGRLHAFLPLIWQFGTYLHLIVRSWNQTAPSHPCPRQIPLLAPRVRGKIPESVGALDGRARSWLPKTTLKQTIFACTDGGKSP